MPSTSYMAIGTDPAEELEHLCIEIAKQYPKVIVFAGQLVFQRDSWFQRLLHNQTAYALSPPAMGRPADGHSADPREVGSRHARLPEFIEGRMPSASNTTVTCRVSPRLERPKPMG